MPEGNDLKKYVRYSDNPKMDNSGISAKEKMTMYGCGGKEMSVTGPVISGGQIREAALAAGIDHGVTITDTASLQKIAGYVNKGESLHYAADSVAREYKFMECGRDDKNMPRAY
jgi:hypothetical protein